MLGFWSTGRRGVPPRPRLNLGCGSRRHPDWTNCDLRPSGPDVLAVDLRRPLPFADASCVAVYASHVLEHLQPDAAVGLLRECRRVLRPAGIVRVVVPDLERIARDYLASLDRAGTAGPDEDAHWEHRWMTVELLDQLVRTQPGGAMRRWWSCDPVPCREFIERRLGTEAAAAIASLQADRRRVGGPPQSPDTILCDASASDRRPDRFAARGERHAWMYDRLSLADLLARAGFVAARRLGPTESGIEGFGGYRLDADAAGVPHKPDSLFMEAACP